ncbi:NAD(P)H:quinone oxidoreductase [Alkalibaculum sp. M08DMB]|uniref:NAD(P)H dehydrogenase (quinone) n=1 Tax=Alkalibaculum sporogenes TaxID=2655001 RepID=A0A6A7KBP2_9FIRM|nr:NAD(P)H:quinone oxidoreductase [Alkalibaculum sporogenes]MPW26826.1 NAD(P)H:quinone oxidoreductase [Alkalibaculum sporogenes]
MKMLILFYSTYGHTYKMAEAVAEGAREIKDAEVTIKRVPETLPVEVIEQIGALEAQSVFSHIPIVNTGELSDYDAIVFGTPTRFGNMAGQMRNFLDTTGGLWASGSLIGKVSGAFTSSGTQHGGQESTILSIHTTLLHHGMIIVGLPYSFSGQSGVDEVKGGSPYGASTIAGASGERQPSKIELDGARFQGKHIASITSRLGVQGDPIKTRTFDL